MALFTITTSSYVNQPPSQVGNNTVSALYGTTRVFTRADFTTETTPPYSDPEGDAAFQLRITSLPSTGILQLNNVNVTLNQVINFTDIDAGLFTYVPDNNVTSSYDAIFNFEIADSGSGIFVG
jgi:hypothetical protein